MGIGYFFDSYALIESLIESPNFKKYIDQPITITLLNLIETTYYFLVNFGEEKSKNIYESLKEYVAEPSSEDILLALKFRFQNKKKSLSYADCLGYIYAKNHGMLFLTGDDAFKHLENVEFVK